MTDELQAAYDECLHVARSHYENFPVASWLVPAHLRIHVAAIYNFARRADDLADEGNDAAQDKIVALDAMGKSLDQCLAGQDNSDYLFLALANTIGEHQLDPALFHDLISAFKQDVTKTRYRDFAEVLDYCRRSANPVGRLMLQLFDQASDENNADSDKICSALQLINFMQDIQQDLLENDRVYFPMDEMLAAGVNIEDLKKKSTEPQVVEFVRAQTTRAKNMLLEGAGLGKRLNGRFGMEIRAIISGGLHICNALLNQGNDIYARPRLGVMDKLGMLKDSITRSI
ncbi:MAG TPA: squalene synthase HpnC [Gammaproteobacteria bacterium]|jgi:squalene synthase HpnC